MKTNNIDNITTQQTITSMEIAEITGRMHQDVIRSIRNMEPAWENVRGSKFALSYRTIQGQGKKKYPYYTLTKTECLFVATKFNDEARAKLVLRWEQLEKERLADEATVPAGSPAGESNLPADPSQLTRKQILLMALMAEEECQRLNEQNRLLQNNMIHLSLELGRRYQLIQQYAPEAIPLLQIPGYEQWQKTAQILPPAQQTAESTPTYTATQLAREYGMKAVPFNSLLHQLGIQYQSAAQWLLAPDYAGRGYTLTKHVTVHEQGHPRRKPFTVWTRQGRQFIHDTLALRGIMPTADNHQQTQKGGTQ